MGQRQQLVEQENKRDHSYIRFGVWVFRVLLHTRWAKGFFWICSRCGWPVGISLECPESRKKKVSEFKYLTFAFDRESKVMIKGDLMGDGNSDSYVFIVFVSFPSPECKFRVNEPTVWSRRNFDDTSLKHTKRVTRNLRQPEIVKCQSLHPYVPAGRTFWNLSSFGREDLIYGGKTSAGVKRKEKMRKVWKCENIHTLYIYSVETHPL